MDDDSTLVRGRSSGGSCCSFLLNETEADAARAGGWLAVDDHRGVARLAYVLRGVGQEGEVVKSAMRFLHCSGNTLSDAWKKMATLISATLI
eukprot:6898798-Pyramimonas_sp.AAC.1